MNGRKAERLERLTYTMSALLVIGAFVLGLVGVWTDDYRWGKSAVLFALAGVVGLCFWCVWKDEQ